MIYLARLANALFLSSCVALIASGCSDSAQSQSGEYEVVQLIGNYNNATIEAVRSDLVVVPFSPDYNPQLTPMMIAPGVLDPVDALTQQEKDAIKASYEAGQTLAIISPSTIDVEALHELLGAGAAYTSTTHPIHMAYITRMEKSNPVSRVLQNVRASPSTAQDAGADERAYARAYTILVEDLKRAPLQNNESAPIMSEQNTDLAQVSLQTTFLTSTTSGNYSTTVNFYAAHICESNQSKPQPYDMYLVTSSGDWTASDAKWQSASAREGELYLANCDGEQCLVEDWKDTDDYCDGGIAIASDVPFNKYDLRLCRYMNYPKQYSVSFVPPADIKTDQADAEPSATQGTASSYSTGFAFSLSGNVNISGKGPAAGLQVGMTWSEKTTVSVPPLLVKAGIAGTQGRYTDYVYCTGDTGESDGNCISTVQMTGSGVCVDYDVGEPEDGQKPSGSMSSIAQSVQWLVGEDGTYPGVYGNATHYPITVNWSVDLATSTSRLWSGPFSAPGSDENGPTGMCNDSGCSCSIETTTNPLTASYTFKVPLPSSVCSNQPPTPPPPAPGSDCSAAFCAANPGASCTATTSCEYCDKGECHT
ncbi:MAG: hypothetical protein GY813_03105 [Halieaceae bacterium]|nr:hypothetical protein [Halieaceae bacterium]